jgi:hypothetical protein
MCTGIHIPSHFYTITNINVYPGFYSRPDDDQFLFSQTSVVMARTPTLTNEQMEQHIELFHEEPCLWDINDADYMNINSRTAALTRIGGVMKLSSDK